MNAHVATAVHVADIEAVVVTRALTAATDIVDRAEGSSPFPGGRDIGGATSDGSCSNPHHAIIVTFFFFQINQLID